MAKIPKLPKCDCLNFCGDDPDLEKEKCAPCTSAVRLSAEKVKRQAVGVRLKEAIEAAKRDGQVTISAYHMAEFEKYIFGQEPRWP